MPINITNSDIQQTGVLISASAGSNMRAYVHCSCGVHYLLLPNEPLKCDTCGSGRASQITIDTQAPSWFISKATNPSLVHLGYDDIGSALAGVRRHPQEVMKGLGITYQKATPQSLFDAWWFWNCSNVPQDLPSFIEPLKVTPSQAIGHGLTQEDVDQIEAQQKEVNGG